MSKAKIAKQNKRRGRRNEVETAKRLGGKAIGALSGEDILHERYSIECKSCQVFRGEKFMLQAEKNAPEGKIPLVVVHVTGQRRDNDLVMVRMKDFEELEDGYALTCKAAEEALGMERLNET